MILESLRFAFESRANTLHRIHSWAPAKAQSYKIIKIKKHGKREFLVTVTYSSRREPGWYKLGEWSWKSYCLEGKRFPVLKH